MSGRFRFCAIYDLCGLSAMDRRMWIAASCGDDGATCGEPAKPRNVGRDQQYGETAGSVTAWREDESARGGWRSALRQDVRRPAFRDEGRRAVSSFDAHQADRSDDRSADSNPRLYPADPATRGHQTICAGP